MSDAVILTLNNNEDPYIRIYAYLDDACREKKTMPLNGGECLQALGAIMDQCECSLAGSFRDRKANYLFR